MCIRDRPDVASAQASLGGGIIAGRVLRFEIGRGRRPHLGRNRGGSDGESDAVQEIATRNFRAHSECLIAFVGHFGFHRFVRH